MTTDLERICHACYHLGLELRVSFDVSEGLVVFRLVDPTPPSAVRHEARTMMVPGWASVIPLADLRLQLRNATADKLTKLAVPLQRALNALDYEDEPPKKIT